MSTRAQIIIKDKYEEIWFYRHSDGYPDGALPTLNKFLDWVKTGKIRDNASQAAGWLVILGHWEYRGENRNDNYKIGPLGLNPRGDSGNGMGWKVGAYEPCAPQLQLDIEYLYTVDLDAKTITWISGDELEEKLQIAEAEYAAKEAYEKVLGKV